MAGKTFDSFLIVHKTSACSPTGHSPKLNLYDGEMDKRTGKAVPVMATSTIVPVNK